MAHQARARAKILPLPLYHRSLFLSFFSSDFFLGSHCNDLKIICGIFFLVPSCMGLTKRRKAIRWKKEVEQPFLSDQSAEIA